ncbi:MAG: hypothetical protein EHM43_13305 [Ignavibacteriae bacterium]|nr:MAG: hypothetical protein EHM43_13305 [Ignavibacteriota bacterium]
MGYVVGGAASMIVKRSTLGRPLTHNEFDGNFNELNRKKLQRRASVRTTTSLLAPSTAYNFYDITALSSDLIIAQPVGTFEDGTQMLYKFKDDGTARAISWHATFRGVGTDLPQLTRPNKVMYVGAVFNSADAIWDVVAVAALN